MTRSTRPQADLFEEAADWVLRLNAVPHDAALRQQFDQWLAAPGHAAAWAEVRQTWDGLGAIAHLNCGSARAALRPAQPERRARPTRRARWPRRITALAAGIAAIWIAWIAVPPAIIAMEADYRTATAQRETIHTRDGSAVDLAGASAISIDIGRAERRVRLLKGEAFFDVARDNTRPFVVDAAGVEVTVLGTAFNVLVTSESTTIALLHGSVRAMPATSTARGDAATIVLEPGQKITIWHGTGATYVAPITAEEIGAWREGLVFLDDLPFSEAAEIIERYHPAWISVPDDVLATRRVSGMIDLTEPEAALALLAGLFGAQVREVTPFLRLVTRF